MINTVELEKRWIRYKTRIFSSLFFILFFVVAIPYLSFYLFEQYSLLIDKDENLSKVVIENNLTKEVVIDEDINDVILAPSIPIIDFSSEKRIDREVEQKKAEQKEINQKKAEQSRVEKERAYRQKIAKRRALERKRALAKKEASQKRELIKAKASSALSSNELNKEPKKINFQSSSSNYMAIMKRKFEQNKNPREAILIAKAYYKAGNYVESEKWALSANNLNKENEESWFLFAKSKAKLGKRRESLTILLSYYKKTKSPKAKELIDKIKEGSL